MDVTNGWPKDHNGLEPLPSLVYGSLSSAQFSLSGAVNHSLDDAQPDGHWVGELRSSPTVTAEYVFLYQALHSDLKTSTDALSKWFLSIQKEDGSWGMAPDHPGDVSTTTEVYLALKILGYSPDHSALLKAQDFMIQHGGIARVRVFTRIYLAMFGLFPWDAVPEMPAELIYMPPQAPINIYSLSSWARSTIVPLLIICHHRPIYALPNGKAVQNDFLEELWYASITHSVIRKAPSLWEIYYSDITALTFQAIDRVLYFLGGLRSSPTRPYARRKCIHWILNHQEVSGDWAGIFPPMHIGVLALLLEGHTLTDDPVVRGLEAIERFVWQDEEGGKRVQACVSPVWDTALTVIALCDAGLDHEHPSISKATAWLANHQIFSHQGDWRINNSQTTAGGFSFEYHNDWYPDVDDTAAVILAFLKANPKSASENPVICATEWIFGMQNRDGGWGAFDKDNDKLYLNKIPFSDMDSLCDPSTADVTGRVLEAFGLLAGDSKEFSVSPLLREHIVKASDRAIAFLAECQERNGSWYGRWGVNYIYGTSNVLCGLAYHLQMPRVKALIRAATRWLESVQNSDGGWGEGVESYSNPELSGCGPSTPSQTAWAIMGLFAGKAFPAQSNALKRGIQWLIDHQKSDIKPKEERGDLRQSATWVQTRYTGTGFPGHFFLDYDLYKHYFPIMALGRYVGSLNDRDM